VEGTEIPPSPVPWGRFFMEETKIQELEVLVIGGGGAGAMAAIHAAREVSAVGLVEKGIFGKAGCTPMGAYSMCAAFGNADPRDNPRVHLEDTIRQGRFINNQELVDIFTREAPERVMELISFGAKFDRDEKGKLKQGMMAGHSYPRACFFDRRTGPMIMGTLARQAKKTPQIQIFEEILIVDLLLEGAGPHYAIGLRWADSTPVVFRASAIVVATGGGAQVYAHNTTSIDNTGDGISLMFQSGAELADMEFVQFYPTTVCAPRLPGLGPTAPAYLTIHTGAKLYNALGEEFVGKKMPGWRFQATRDILSQAIYREIIEGRGSPHGGVYLDVTHLGEERIKRETAFGGYFDKLLRLGVDLTQRPIETTVSAHFFMGGARVNGRGETSLPGLFAAGEAAAGYHGANRLGGNALSEILVSGARAGQYAAAWARERRGMKGPETEIPLRLQSIEEKIARWKKRGSGLRPIEGKRCLQGIMWETAGVVREKKKMQKGLEALAALQEEVEKRLMISPSRRFNRELLDAFELEHMIRISSLILTSALARKESRGAHYRIDYPYPDDEKWLVNIILQRDGDRIRKRQEKVSFSHLKPEVQKIDGKEGNE
jgi:fumarate reductase (CoM/CoB) subunit A